MEDIINKLKETRKLSQSSLKTYESLFKSLNKQLGYEELKESNFEYKPETIDIINSFKINKRKTLLSALVSLTNDDRYRDAMMESIKDYNIEMLKQKKSETQRENWVELDDIKEKMNKLEVDLKNIKIKNNTFENLYKYQQYLLLCLFSGVFIPPRRSKDYVDFKIKNIDFDKDNYYKDGSFVFNSYKTSKTYKTQIIPVGGQLKKIVEKWIKINPYEWLLFDTEGGRMSNVKLSQLFNKMFGKKISVNAFRHTFLTDKYKDINLADLKEDFTKMGSSIQQFETYVKLE